MLAFVFVLLVATSAYAAPSVSISQAPINEIAPARDYGGGYNSGLASNLWELSDGGDTNIYILTLQQVLLDLANQPDSYAKAQAVAQTLAILGELAYGVSGDACAAANAVNSFASGGGARSYVGQLAVSIDNIALLASNPNSLRYTNGPRGQCAGGGRTYQFEAAWDAILNKATPYTIGLVNEEYCAAKRLYQAFNARSNNVGAAATAAALPPVVDRVLHALNPILAFLRAVISGSHSARGLAVAAKTALTRSH